MANSVYRGSARKQPETVNLPVSGAYLPATFVESTGSALTQITTAVDKRPLLLGNRDFYSQDITTAYTSGETGVAYKLEPGMEVQAAMAAGTYAYGAPLTVAASGRLAAATAGAVVVAWYDQAGATLSAGDLADVVIANSYVKA